ncbi:MAG: hypothetical protein H0T89_19875 [Deltaproteobacteria bacterium]|nr:hypothetical protein [Deltaproteobacteria bacterium]
MRAAPSPAASAPVTTPSASPASPSAPARPATSCTPPYYYEGTKKVFKPACL